MKMTISKKKKMEKERKILTCWWTLWAENHGITECKIITEVTLIDLPKAFITINYTLFKKLRVIKIS